ncbi:MAG: hypothetical protein IJO03_04460 [Clostridia bacterium]|nr:hypothetical protein [Clostridia bacterium]
MAVYFKERDKTDMEQPKTTNNLKEYYVIDFAHVVKSVWHRAWVVVISSVLAAVIAFSVAAFAITPTYSSSIMLYVNNSSFTVGDLGFSISSSEISAAQSLVKTYTVLLKNRTTLEKIIKHTGVEYTWEELYEMIEAAPVNETEIMEVTVTSTDPYEAEKLANGIAKILPQRVSEIVEGSSMEVVDSAIANKEKVAPNITQFTAIGFVLGALFSLILLVILALLDNTVHDEEYIINNYNYPVLAKIPDLLDTGAKKYSYYNSYKKSN